ncbi:ferritin-like metal-binding protein YciE [Haloferula luteola]|uniref:Ferritin-like metal-binding protein YciE n=1 Tax=Haloferula luteola TaxID=595692 RepID=A0A840UYK5_9BACT|nr:ferritin-like domain-containing protein [Haloferula luteola]MBB5350862.1 ferritin-like metal-binding protein YciE [Haloferula luteola]
MIENLKSLYFDQLRDLYSAETQMIEALPKMMAQASHPDLKDAFSDHLEETRGQRSRLEKICARHGIQPAGETCDAMKGLVKEAEKHGNETLPGSVRDAVLIAAANRVEHYEIAGYGTAKCYADVLGFDEDVKLLDETLEQEGAADKKLTKIATGGLFHDGVNEAALA